MRNRMGTKELATLFSGIVIVVTPMGLAVSGCVFGNQNQCDVGPTGPLPDPVTVAYTPPVCTAPEAGDISDASDAEVTSDSGSSSADASSTDGASASDDASAS